MSAYLSNILSRNPILDATAHDFNQTLRFQYIAKSVKQLTKAKPNAKVLDVGAGRGTLTHYLTAKRRCEAINLETNRQQKTEDLIVADGTHLPFIDGAFDVIVSSDVLEHIAASDRVRFLGELLRCAESGVVLTFSRIHARNPEGNAIRVFERFSRSVPAWYREHNSCDLVDPDEVVEELKRHKVSGVSVEPIVGFSAVAATGLIQNVPWRAHLRACANVAAYFIVKLTDRQPYYGFGVTATKSKREGEGCLKRFIAKRAANPAPSFSVIVTPRVFPNRNLTELLQSMGRIGTEYEVIIVSSDEGQETNCREALNLALNSNGKCSQATLLSLGYDPGLAYARNVGAALASSNCLVYADDDIILAEDIAPLIGALESGQCHSVQPLILRYPEVDVVDSAGDRLIRLHGIYHAIIRGAGEKLNQLASRLVAEQLPSLRGAFLAIRKDSLKAIGGFDGRLGFNFDDVDLGWRMTIAGFRNIFLPSVKVYHKGGRTTKNAASDERVECYHLVNHHVIQLKVSGVSAWPFILARFEAFALTHCLRKQSVKVALKEAKLLHKMLISRLPSVHRDRKLLSHHRYAGRETFIAMSNQTRFPVA